MAKVFRTLRNNWKKSIFFSVVGYYGVRYFVERERSFRLMKGYCLEAKAVGSKPLPTGSKSKHITLLLNPISSRRKGKDLFYDFSEPLLHLSGFLLNVVKTESADEARNLSGIIEKTNIIAVAGGDGTLSETVTGLLRRDDAEDARTRYGLAVIPTGVHNEFASKLFKDIKVLNDKDRVSQATMAIIKHRVEAKDVVQVQILEQKQLESELTEYIKDDFNLKKDRLSPDLLITPEMVKDTTSRLHLENPTVPSEKKPVYCLTGLRIGQFREADKVISDYPAFMGKTAARIWSIFKTGGKTNNLRATINYAPHCTGCKNCVKPKESTFWTRITNLIGFTPAETIDIPDIVNPSCGEWTSLCVDTSEFNVLTEGDGSLKVQVGPKLKKIQYILEFIKRNWVDPSPVKQTEFHCSEIEILPEISPEFCSIDNEEFEMKAMKLKVLKNRLFFYVPLPLNINVPYVT